MTPLNPLALGGGQEEVGEAEALPRFAEEPPVDRQDPVLLEHSQIVLERLDGEAVGPGEETDAFELSVRIGDEPLPPRMQLVGHALHPGLHACPRDRIARALFHHAAAREPGCDQFDLDALQAGLGNVQLNGDRRHALARRGRHEELPQRHGVDSETSLR